MSSEQNRQRRDQNTVDDHWDRGQPHAASGDALGAGGADNKGIDFPFNALGALSRQSSGLRRQQLAANAFE